MGRRLGVGLGMVTLGAALAAGGVGAQPPGAGGHAAMHAGPGAAGGLPTQPGQDAFAAIAEVVRILDADPRTDWSRVDLERLRQHLVDMNEVVLHAAVRASDVPGGLVVEVTGTGRTAAAIRAIVGAHAAELARMPDLAASSEAVPGGVRLTVTAREAEDARAVARLRGLGFIGLLTLGAHHQSHHLALARGEAMAGHAH